MLAVVIIQKFMKSAQMLLTQLFALFTGMILSSLWITKSESYKIYIPIVLLILLVKHLISDRGSK